MPIKQLRREYYTKLQAEAYKNMQKNNKELFNPVIEPENAPRTAKRAKLNNEPINTDTYVVDEHEDSLKTTFARRAEDENTNHGIIDKELENNSLEDNVDKELNESEVTTEESSVTEFDEEMEKSVFPELNNANCLSNHDDENDQNNYSDYEPEEYDDHINDDYNDELYAEYYEEDRKAAKRAAKRIQKSKGKRYVPDADMSEY